MDFRPIEFEYDKNHFARPATQIVDRLTLNDITSDTRPSVVSNSMETIKTDRGPFQSVQVPNGWHQTVQRIDNTGQMIKMSAAGDDKGGFLGICDRGRSVGEASATAFSDLISKNQDIKAVKVLLPSQIRDLEQVMGYTSVGDNQFTNSNKYPSPRAPVFSLTSAQLINVNRHTVLEVQGNFVDANKTPVNYFRGIFIQDSKDPQKIQEFFAQAPNSSEFTKTESVYRDALKTITW